MLALLINGTASNDAAHAIHAEDRGLQYGDGLFETMLLREGKVRFLAEHLIRLDIGCERLKIAKIDHHLLQQEIKLLSVGVSDGIVKLVVTRGAGGRGYCPASDLTPTRLLSLYALNINTAAQAAITVRWCETRLGRNALLSGIKHLNRLEQVLAQQEWCNSKQGATIEEGLMLDVEGELIGGTSSNLFIVNGGVLYTPDLRFCGIRGVMRGQVLKAADKLGLVIEECALRPADMLQANEVFLTNAVHGIRPVGALDEHRWSIGKITRKLSATLGLW